MSPSPAVLGPGELAAAGRDVAVPFLCRVRLTDARPGLSAAAGDEVDVVCRQVLRLLPGRRLVARAELAGRTVLVKLFFGAGARRYARRDVRGCELLARAGVATPALLGALRQPEAGDGAPLRGLVFEYLAGAVPVVPEDDAGVAAAAAELARLHRAGLRHQDLHLDNFLAGDGGVRLVDGDGVRPVVGRRPLSRRRSLANLAVLCAQRPPLADARLAVVYRAYATVRGWPSAEAPAALAHLTRRQRRERVRRYLDKAQRDCSEYRCRRSWRRYYVCVRAWAGPALEAFAADPEAAMAGAQVVKAGNSATVVRVVLGGRPWIVKRYNQKSLWQSLRRALAPVPRFRLAWLNGQRLHFLGIPTARPVALVERRFGPLRGVAYLVMEDLGETDLTRLVEAGGLCERRVGQVVDLFRGLAAAGLRHGDTKASNFLVTPAGVALVDLDALASAAEGQEKDLGRFLANFDHAPEVRERFAAAFREAGLGQPRG